jgi:ATP-dependent RNA helicase DeaD
VIAFDQLGLSTSLLAAIKDVGYEAPTPVQAKAVPPLPAGRDLIGQAQTGTGKTAAFAIRPGLGPGPVVVGTPGRIMDHLRRGTLSLAGLKTIVLDEADEMLRMGFIDDVDWILAQIPGARQTALFSATMPREIRRIASDAGRGPTLTGAFVTEASLVMASGTAVPPT